MQATDNVHSKQLSLLTSDLERYGFIQVAMESPNAVDLGLLRGEYTDLYHRYVTLQPTHFKRNAVSIGMENGMVTAAAVAGAAILLGILIKLSKWIVDTFFGGSGGGGGGGMSRTEIMFVVIGSHRIIDIAKELANIAKDLGNEKPTAEWVDKLSTNFKTVCSEKEVHTVKSWVSTLHASDRMNTAYINPYVKMTRAFQRDATYDPMASPEYETFKESYSKTKENWNKADDYMHMMKNYDSHVVSNLKSKSIAMLIQDYVKFGEVFIETRNYGFCDLPEIIQIGINGDIKHVREINDKHGDSPNSKKMISIIEQMTLLKRTELKHVLFMSMLLSDYFDMAIHLCNLLTSYSDKLPESNVSRVKELHGELIKLKKK